MIEKLVKLQNDFKEVYSNTIISVDGDSVHVMGIIKLMELEDECNEEIIEKDSGSLMYPIEGYFYYKDVKFYAIY